MRIIFLLFLLLLSTVVLFSCASPVKQLSKTFKSVTSVVDIKKPVFNDSVIDKQIDSFLDKKIAEFRKNPPPPNNDPRKFKNELYITYEDAFISNKYVSVLISVMTYTGGAHPTTILYAQTYDRKTGKQLKAKDLVDDTAKLKPQIIEKLSKQIDNADVKWIKEGVNKNNLENFTVNNDSITFHFSAYEVACYAAGPQKASFKLN